MKIYTEDSLRNFEFWSGGKDRADLLTLEDLDQIETALEELYPEGISDTELNDLFWFEFDWICETAGIDNPEEEE